MAGAGSLATLDVEGKATDVPAPSPRSPDTQLPVEVAWPPLSPHAAPRPALQTWRKARRGASRAAMRAPWVCSRLAPSP